MNEDSPSIYRAAVLQIDRRRIGAVLDLPEDITVASIHFDPEKDALLLRLEGSMLPPVPDGCVMRRVNAHYQKRVAEPGETVTVFVELI